MYQIQLKPRAERDMKQLYRRSPTAFRRVYEALLALADNPRPPQSKRLRGHRDKCSRRVGDYRIIYTIDDEARIVTIVRAWHRREVYRGL